MIEKEENKQFPFAWGIDKAADYFIELAKSISPRTMDSTKAIFEIIKNENQDDTNFAINYEYIISNPLPSPTCTTIFKKLSYRCYTCRLSKNTYICVDCFNHGNHQGHHYEQERIMWGCCDCGHSQMMKKSGFCQKHSQEIGEDIIEESLKNKFIQELHHLFYIYFWMSFNTNGSIKDKIIQVQKNYISCIWEYLETLIQQNYQFKVLCAKMLTSKFSKTYFTLLDKDYTPLELIFRLPNSNMLAAFVRVSYGLFAVKSYQTNIIKQYFRKTKDREEPFIFEHNLHSLNFQFLICLNQITRLVSVGQVQPFQPGNYGSQTNIFNISSAYKKYFGDLSYINSMYMSPIYHKMHLEKLNICEMLNYRRFISSDEPFITHDEYFLKIFNPFAKSIAKQKQLIELKMRQLLSYIINNKEITYCLAHQRVFALLLVAYFENFISKVSIEHLSKFFQSLIEKGITKQMVTKLIKDAIKGKYLSIYFKQKVQDLSNDEQQYIIQQNPLKQMSNYLDMIYHKTLLLLSLSCVNYADILAETIKEIRKINQFSEEQFIELFNFLTTFISTNIDEIIILNELQLSQQEQIFHLYKRLLASIKPMKHLEFKRIAMSLIPNQDVLKILHENQMTNLASPVQIQPLSYSIYNRIYHQNVKDTSLFHLNYLTKNPTLQQLQHLEVFNQQSGTILIQFIKSIQQTPKKELVIKTVQQLIKLFLITSNAQIYHFLQENQLLIKNCQSESLIKSVELALSVDFKKNLNEQNNKLLKKEKYQKKKKERDEKIKGQQNKFLSELNQQQLTTPDNQVCLYCKGLGEQKLYFMCNINFTNLIETISGYKERCHLFIRTCGHKIHNSCYSKILLVSKSTKLCLLCKEEINLLVPNFSRWGSVNQQVTLSEANICIDSFYKIPLSLRNLNLPQFKNYRQFHKENHISMILESIAYQIVNNGLHNCEYYSKQVQPIFHEIFLMLKLLPKACVGEAFAILDQGYKIEETNSFVYRIIRQIFDQLKFYVNQEQYSCTKINFSEPSIVQNIEILIKNINDYEPNRTSISQLQCYIINLDKIIQLPQTLHELNMEIDKCKYCNKATNQIAKCLLCAEKSCYKCASFFIEHSAYVHLGGTAYIDCYYGGLLMFSNSTNNGLTNFRLYQNNFGETLEEMKQISSNYRKEVDTKDFKLDRRVKESLIRSIRESRIRQGL